MTLLQKHNAFPALWNIYFVSGLQQVAPLSVLLIATQRNVCFQSTQIMGHLSWHWVIQGTQLQQKASEGKGVTFNQCQKFCAWATGEQGKAFLGTDLEMTEAFAIQCMDTVQLYFFNVWGPCFHTPYPAKLCIRGELGTALLTDTIHAIEGYMPQLWLFQMEMAQLYMLCFCQWESCWKFLDEQRKQLIHLWEKGVLNLYPVFTAWKEKKLTPPQISTLISD